MRKLVLVVLVGSIALSSLACGHHKRRRATANDTQLNQPADTGTKTAR